MFVMVRSRTRIALHCDKLHAYMILPRIIRIRNFAKVAYTVSFSYFRFAIFEYLFWFTLYFFRCRWGPESSLLLKYLLAYVFYIHSKCKKNPPLTCRPSIRLTYREKASSDLCTQYSLYIYGRNYVNNISLSCKVKPSSDMCAKYSP